MSNNSTPNKELELIAKAKAAQAYANTNLAALGMVAADILPFTFGVTTADTAMNGYQSAKTNASSQRAGKDTSLVSLQKEWKRLKTKALTNPNLTDAQREGLGIPVTGKVKAMAVNTSHTMPLVQVDNSKRLAHIVSYCESTTPSTKARPKGVKGAEVWMAVLGKDVAPPRDVSGMKFVGEQASSPVQMKFAVEDAGKVAWYLLRWVDTLSQPGQWSEPTGSMIMA